MAKKEILYALLKIVFYLVVIHIIASLLSLYLLFRPTPLLSESTPSDYGLSYEDVYFYTEDDLRIKGWYVPSLKEDVPTVVLLHGYPADKGNLLYPVQYLVENFNVLLFDFRYMGESEGSYSTLGVKERKDLHAALDFLEEEKKEEEVFLWGFSMGAAVSLMVAPERDVVKAVVSDSSYAQMRGMPEQLYILPFFRKTLSETTLFLGGIIIRTDLDKNSPLSKAPYINVPVFLMHSKGDKIVDFDHALKLKEALNTRVETLFLDEDTHGGLSSKSYGDVEEFLLGLTTK